MTKIIVTEMPQMAGDCPFAVHYPFDEQDIIPNCLLKCNKTGTDTEQFSYTQNHHTCDPDTCPFLVGMDKINST